MARNPVWTFEETLLALCLYYELPSGQMDKSNRKVIELSHIMSGRNANSIAMKLNNFKRLDEDATKGLTHGAAMEETVWNRYINDPEALFAKRDEILRGLNPGEEIAERAGYSLPESEMEKLAQQLDFSAADRFHLAKWRDGQQSFRLYLMKGYGGQCCLSGVKDPGYLVASHIKPWAVDLDNRLNPRNGLLLNVFLDKAFDSGDITVDARDYTVRVSSRLKDDVLLGQLKRYEGEKITLPQNPERWPERDFLLYHNDVVFEKI